MKFPSTLPEWLTQLFTTGYKGFTFWNLVTTIAVLIVVVEAMQYDKMLKEKGQKPNITTVYMLPSVVANRPSAAVLDHDAEVAHAVARA